MDALNHLVKQRCYISDDVLAETAAALGMSTAELDEVATFYNLIFRKPVGESVILLCHSVTCWMLGSDAIATHITKRLGIKPGETSGDGKFTLLPIVCLGHCDHAPAMMLGGGLHGGLDAARVDELLAGANL